MCVALQVAAAVRDGATTECNRSSISMLLLLLLLLSILLVYTPTPTPTKQTAHATRASVRGRPFVVRVKVWTKFQNTRIARNLMPRDDSECEAHTLRCVSRLHAFVADGLQLVCVWSSLASVFESDTKENIEFIIHEKYFILN